MVTRRQLLQTFVIAAGLRRHLDAAASLEYGYAAITWGNDFTKAIDLDPKHAAAYYERGRCYAVKKSTQQAMNDYRKAVTLNPIYADAFYSE